MTVSQVTDEVLYKGLIEMQELDASGWGPPGHTQGAALRYIKVVSRISPHKVRMGISITHVDEMHLVLCLETE